MILRITDTADVLSLYQPYRKPILNFVPTVHVKKTNTDMMTPLLGHLKLQIWLLFKPFRKSIKELCGSDN